MAEIEVEFRRVLSNSNMDFRPSKPPGGASLHFTNLDLTQAEQATLTWLLTNGPELLVEISENG